MPTMIPTTLDLYHALLRHGYKLPDECVDVSLEMPVGGVFRLVMHVNLTDKTLAILGKALVDIADQKV